MSQYAGTPGSFPLTITTTDDSMTRNASSVSPAQQQLADRTMTLAQCDNIGTPNALLTAGATLPTGTLNVNTTSGFPSSGTLNVTTTVGNVVVVNYSGVTSTSFTGCTGGSGSVAIGGAVRTVSAQAGSWGVRGTGAGGTPQAPIPAAGGVFTGGTNNPSNPGSGPGLYGFGTGAGAGGVFLGGATGLQGVLTTAGAGSGGVGLQGNGDGGGAGVSGQGGISGGSGVSGVGGANGIGVLGQGGSGNGIGVTGIGSGSSAGGAFVAGGSGMGCSGQGAGSSAGGTFTGGSSGGTGVVGLGGAGGQGGTFTAGAGNQNGVTAFGSGSGAGVAGTGGSTGYGLAGYGGVGGGNGVFAQGTGTSGIGLFALGAGSGAGISATGGSTAPGGTFSAGPGSNAQGVTAFGSGTGAGITATGGSTGGTLASAGVYAIAGASGSPAIIAHQGPVVLDTAGGASPTPNALYKDNVPKAWGRFKTSGTSAHAAGSLAVYFGVAASVTYVNPTGTQWGIQVTLANAMSGSDYVVVPTAAFPGSNYAGVPMTTKIISASVFQLFGQGVQAGALVPIDLDAAVVYLDFAVFGGQ